MRTILSLLAACGLAACATTGGGTARPVEAVRYHLGGPFERGTLVVQAAEGGDGLIDQPFADAVGRQLTGIGYVPAAPGGEVQYLAIVGVQHRWVDGPPRSSGFSIGLGGGGFSGGRHGGIGLGGGVSFPVGSARPSRWEATELMVTIKRRVDLSPVWEGQARAIADSRAPKEAIAEKLARALFTDFPGESGRTIEVR